MSRPTESGRREASEDPRQTPFASTLFYVLGFMAALAFLAYAAACFLHHR